MSLPAVEARLPLTRNFKIVAVRAGQTATIATRTGWDGFVFSQLTTNDDPRPAAQHGGSGRIGIHSDLGDTASWRVRRALDAECHAATEKSIRDYLAGKMNNRKLWIIQRSPRRTRT